MNGSVEIGFLAVFGISEVSETFLMWKSVDIPQNRKSDYIDIKKCLILFGGFSPLFSWHHNPSALGKLKNRPDFVKCQSQMHTLLTMEN